MKDKEFINSTTAITIKEDSVILRLKDGEVVVPIETWEEVSNLQDGIKSNEIYQERQRAAKIRTELEGLKRSFKTYDRFFIFFLVLIAVSIISIIFKPYKIYYKFFKK